MSICTSNFRGPLQEPIRVLVRTTLPRRAGVAEVDRRPERFRDLDVPGHLGALVPGDRPQQAIGQITHPRFQRLVQRLAIPAGQMQQPDQPRLPFDESADRGSLPPADDEIPLPVTGFGSVGRFEGPVVDRQHGLLEPGPAPLRVLVSAPVIPPCPKRRAVLRCQLRRPQERGSGRVEDLVDALAAQLQLRVLRECEPQVPADLFRAPPLPQHLHHRPPQDRLDLDTPSRAAGPPGRRPPVRIERPIAPPGTYVNDDENPVGSDSTIRDAPALIAFISNTCADSQRWIEHALRGGIDGVHEDFAETSSSVLVPACGSTVLVERFTMPTPGETHLRRAADTPRD